MPRLTACLAIALVLAASLRAAEAPAPLTEAAARAFAEKLQASIVEGKPEAFDAAFDLDALAARAIKRYNPPAAFLTGFMQGFGKGFKVGGQITRELGTASGFKLLKLKPDGPNFLAVFRFYNRDGGLNYHEYLIAPGAAGPRVLDFYVYITGEWFSETIRRLVLPAILAAKSRDNLLNAEDRDFETNLKAMQTITSAIQAGDFELALQRHAQLPETVRKEKVAMLQRITAAEKVGEKEYQEALEAFEKDCPGDPALDLVSLDANINRKQWAAAHQCLDRLAARAGPDAYLDFLHANVHLLEEKYPAALAAAVKAIEAEPALQDPYLTLITVTLKQQDHPATAKALARFEKQFGRIELDLEKEAAYAGFVKSPDFTAWQKSRPAATAPDAAAPDAAPQPVKPNE